MVMDMRRIITLIVLLVGVTTATLAQIGEYRNRFSVGVSGGYVLNSMGFTPTVVQSSHGGMTFGVAGRYTSEKYFSTLCAIQAEVNVTQLGWKQNIMTVNDEAVINPESGEAEMYQRDITYVQIPLLAHLSWGRETNGVCGFLNAGPQLGFMLSEKTKQNYATPFTSENFPDTWTSETGRVSQVVAQETMEVEKSFDYGIAAGAGVEWHIRGVGRFSLEGRYYYGLGNIWGDSKRDYFAASNHMAITIKVGYMMDL